MYRKNSHSWLKHADFLVLDLICMQVAFLISYWLRMGPGNPYAAIDYRDMAVYMELFDLIILLAAGTLEGVLRRGYYAEFATTVKHTFLVVAACTICMFTLRTSINYSRIVIYLTYVIYFCLTYFSRVLLKKYLRHSRRNQGKRTLLLITTRAQATDAIRTFLKYDYSDLQLCGVAILDADLSGQTIGNTAVVADGNTVTDYVCREWVDEVLIVWPDQSGRVPEGSNLEGSALEEGHLEDSHVVDREPETTKPEGSGAADSNVQSAGLEVIQEKLMQQLYETGIPIHVALGHIQEICGRRMVVDKIGGYMAVTSSMNVMTDFQAFLKRAMDIAGGLVGCVLTGVIFLFAAPQIYKASPGPIFFKQVRIGRSGKRFQMYKFRSMYLDAEERKAELLAKNRIKDGMMFKMEFDPRVIGNVELPDGTRKTGIGDFLRRTSLDEFPQFFNVLKGDMSLVGTRPPTLDEWNKYELHHRARLAIKPGITGMWQVSGRSEITDFEEVVRLDTEYINHWSIGLDIKILCKTVTNIFRKDGAM